MIYIIYYIGLYCNVTWDNAMCWDYTPAGTEAQQSCPDYINGLNSAGMCICFQEHTGLCKQTIIIVLKRDEL